MTKQEFLSTVQSQWANSRALPSAAMPRITVNVCGNRGDLDEALRESDVSAVFQALCQIDDVARGEDLASSSFARQGQEFARQMIAELKAAGIERGEHVWKSGTGRTLNMGRWRF